MNGALPAELKFRENNVWVAKEESVLTTGVSSLFLALNEVSSLRSSKLKHGFLSTPCELERFEDGSEILWEEGARSDNRGRSAADYSRSGIH